MYKQDDKYLQFRYKKTTKIAINSKYQNKNPDVKLACSLIQNNQVEFKKAMEAVEKESPSNKMKVQLFYKLFEEIKQKELDSYFMDTLLSAYHFGNLKFVKEVKQKFNPKGIKNNPDLFNKEKIIGEIEKNITENIEFKKMNKILEYLEKANYVDAKKFLPQIKNNQIQQFFSYFSFCKLEYRKFMVGDNMSVENQNIDLTNLDKVTNSLISKWSQLEIKQNFCSTIKCFFLMKTYRIKDFNSIASKLKDQSFKNNLIQANRVVFNMNVFIKLIKTLQKDEKFTFQAFQGQMYGQFQYISFFKDHLQTVNFYLDCLCQALKGDDTDIKGNQIQFKSIKIFPYTKLKLEQLKKTILNTKTAKKNQKQKNYDQLLAWYSKKFNQYPVNLVQRVIEILNNFYQNHKNNQSLLNLQFQSQQLKNKFQNMKKKCIKQEQTILDFDKIISIIKQIYQYITKIKNSKKENNKSPQKELNYVSHNNNINKAQKQKDQYNSDKKTLILEEASIIDICSQILSSLKDISQISNESNNSKGKKTSQNQGDKLLNQNLRNLLQKQIEQNKKNKSELQNMRKPQNSLNQVKSEMYAQRQKYQQQIKDNKSMYDTNLRLKQEAIKKLQFQLANYKKEAEQKLKSIKSESKDQQEKRLTEQRKKIQDGLLKHFNELVDQMEKNKKKHQNELKDIKQENQKQIKIKQSNFNKEKIRLDDVIKTQKETLEKQIRMNEREYQKAMKDVKEKFEKLQQDKHQVDIDIEQYIKATDKQAIQISELTAKNQEFVIKIKDLEKNLIQKAKQLQQQQRMIQDLMNSLNNSRIQENKIDNLNQKHESQKKMFFNHLNLKQQQIKNKSTLINSLQKTLNNMKSQKEIMAGQMNQKKKLLNQKHSKILQLSQAIKKKQEQVTQKTKEIGRKTKQIYDKKEQFRVQRQKLQKEIQQKKRMIEQLILKQNSQAQKRNLSLNNQKSLKQEKAKHIQIQQKLELKTQQLQKMKAKNQENINQLNLKLEQKTKQFKQTETKNQKIIKQLNQKEKQLTQKNSSIQFSTEQNSKAKVGLLQENNKLKNTIIDLNQQLKDIQQFQRLKALKQKQLQALLKATQDISEVKKQYKKNLSRMFLLQKDLINQIDLLFQKLQIPAQQIKNNNDFNSNFSNSKVSEDLTLNSSHQHSFLQNSQKDKKQQSIQQYIKNQEKQFTRYQNQKKKNSQKIKKVVKFIQSQNASKKQKQLKVLNQKQELELEVKRLKQQKEQKKNLNNNNAHEKQSDKLSDKQSSNLTANSQSNDQDKKLFLAFENSNKVFQMKSILSHATEIHPQKQSISSINLIYKYQKHFKEAFSKKTTNKQNLLIIARTINGQFIGGFTSHGFGFTQKYNNDGYGFLFSTGKQDKINFFDLKSPQKVPSQNFKTEIKFGYRELVIKNGNQLQTDFATPRHQSRGHYLNKNKISRQEFVISNSKEFESIQLQDYEIYQLTFDNQIILQAKDHNQMLQKLKNTQNQTQMLKSQIQQSRKTFRLKDQQMESVNKKISQLQQKLSEQIQKNLQQKAQSNKKLNKSNQTIMLLDRQYQEAIKQLNQLQIVFLTQRKQRQNQRSFNMDQMKKLKMKLDDFENEKFQLNNQIQKLSQQIKQLKNEDKINWQGKFNQLSMKYQAMERKNQNQIEGIKLNLSDKVTELERFIQQKSKQLAKIKQKYQRQLDIVKQDYMDEIQKINNKLMDLADINEHLKIQSSNYKKKINQKDQALKEIEQKSSSNRVYELYFQGDVFDNEPYEQLVWFVDQLQNHCEMRIRKTRLLYRKDDHSNVNFHVYFDNLQDIVLVIKLKNGMVLAGYTHPAFIKGQKQPGQTGFIFSFHTKQVFGQKREGVQSMDPRPRPITYDEYYMIFGNSQIRLRFRQDMLFSNFGIMGAFYDNKKQPVNCLLGEEKQRESQILTYEIFQVKF